jgi:hypothetical protein
MYSQEEAERLAEKIMKHIKQISNTITKNSSWNIRDNEVDILLDDVQSNTMKIAIKYKIM